ncbi:MAG: hypothetical protein Q9162_004700 [Coniocarpon cinnabarinum]
MESDGALAPQRKPLPRTPSPSNLLSGQPSLGSRPLSDIREITEPSLLDSVRRKATTGALAGGPRTSDSSKHPKPLPNNSRWGKDQVNAEPGPVEGIARSSSQRAPQTLLPKVPTSRQNRRSPEQVHDDDTTKSSLFSINPGKVPHRSSSKPRHRPSRSLSREPAVAVLASRVRRSVSNRRKSSSPLKEAAERLSASSPVKPRIPSKTFVKVDSPTLNDILASPIYHHPRVQLEIQLAASLFVGGSTVEGLLRLVVDEATRLRHRKSLTLERLSVDLIGVEEVVGNKRHIFLSLGNEIVDNEHPPPQEMIDAQAHWPSQGQSWLLIPSVNRLPFLLTLPLEVGPPPFKSKNARIRYLLSATLFLKDMGRDLCVRSTQETSILSVYDPERALVSLPSPLTSSDELLVHRGKEKITVAAGLHRQVWVNGTTLFADVHIVNKSRKHIKRLELHLEQIILFYRHAAASTLEQSASQARLFDATERMTICKTIVKQSSLGWLGVPAYSTDLRTCSIDLPRGHATVKCNKYFEVRYLLNVMIPISHSLSTSKKSLMVQLPIILIHMSSLDVPTNSVAQVAAAIEEKRNPREQHGNDKGKPNSNSLESSTAASLTTSDAAVARGSPQRRTGRKAKSTLQGRAFAAPRAASVERSRAQQQDLQHLGNILDKSPRKSQAYKHQATQATSAAPSASRIDQREYSYQTPPNNRKGQVITDAEADELRLQLGVGDDSSRSFKVLPTPPVPAISQRRDPPRSASAMGYYMPGDDASHSQRKENRRPSFDARPSVEPRPSLDVPPRPRPSAESARPKMRAEWRDGGRSPVGGVQLAGVPEAPKKVGGRSPNDGKPAWSAQERERWRPHWL